MFKVLSLLALFTLLSCAQTTSEDIATENLEAQFKIEAELDSSLVTCRATFRVGDGLGGTFVKLSEGDRVFCNGIPMVKSELFGMVSYITTLPYDERLKYVVKFEREVNEESYSSNVLLPPKPVITAPVEGQQISKSENLLTTRWLANIGTSVRVSASYSATQNSFNEISTNQSPENGFVHFTMDYEGLLGSFQGSVNFKRILRGNLDPNLNGFIDAENSSRVGIQFVD